MNLAELSYKLGPSFIWAELVLGRVVRNSRRRGTKTVNLHFLIPQRAHKVPFLIIQRARSALFYKVTVPFFVPGVNTSYCQIGCFSKGT